MGGDYTDLQSWQAGEQIFNWPTLGQNPVAEVYNDWPTGLPTNIYLDGWYSDANHPPVIRAAAGERHTGKRLSAGNYTGAALAGTVYDDAIFDVNDPNFQISGLILDVIPARGGGIRSRYGSSMHAQNCYFEGLIINNCSKLHGIELTGENDNVRVSNVLVTNGAADSYGIMVGLRANAWVYSCSIVDCGTGVYIDSNHAAADIVLKNILCHGNGTDFVRANSLGTLSVSNCASSDGTASTWGGTGNRANQTFTFEDEGNDDFHLSSSDAGAKGYGADLSGDANYPFNDDIDGDTRSAPWDIGADQVAGGADTSLDGNAAATTNAAGALSTQLPLASAALSATTAIGSLNTSIPLSGAAAAVGSVSGNLTAQITLSGDALAQAIAVAGLSTQILLGGGAQSQASATGELAGGAAALSGVAQGQTTAVGDLTIQIRLQGAALAQSSATADLTATTSGLAGNAQASASSSAALTTAIPVLGAAASVASAGGALITAIPLTGAAASVSSTIGSLDLALTLSGAALAQAAAGGVLTTQITLAGSAVSRAAASGALASGSYTLPPSWRLVRVRPETRVLAA